MLFVLPPFDDPLPWAVLALGDTPVSGLRPHFQWVEADSVTAGDSLIRQWERAALAREPIRCDSSECTYIFRSGADMTAAGIRDTGRPYTLFVCAVPHLRGVAAVPRECLMLAAAIEDERWVRAVTFLGQQRGYDRISLGEELTFTIAGEVPALDDLLGSMTTLFMGPPF